MPSVRKANTQFTQGQSRHLKYKQRLNSTGDTPVRLKTCLQGIKKCANKKWFDIDALLKQFSE